jgi:hypothetical protein
MVHEEPHDYFRFTLHVLRHILRRADLIVMRIDTAGGAWRLIGQILVNHKAHGRRWKIPIVSGIAYYAVLVGGNLFFSMLDTLNTNRSDPTNYMVIARKAEKVT